MVTVLRLQCVQGWPEDRMRHVQVVCPQVLRDNPAGNFLTIGLFLILVR